MAAPTLITAVRGTDNQSDETRRARDVSPALAQLEPDAGPLITLMSKTRSESCTDPKYEWFEDELKPRFDLLAAALTAAAATMTVTNYKFFRKGDLVRVNRKEIVYVSTTPTSTAVSITRAFGETAAAAASNSDQLHILGNTNEEGSVRRSLLSTQKVPKYNYTGIVRDPFGVTKTAMATKTFAGVDFTTEQAKELIEHKKSIELMNIAGERKEELTGTKPKRSTRGIRNWISTNVLNVAGELTETALDSHLRVSYRYGAKVKLGLLSPILAQAINGFAKDRLRVVDKSSVYGVTLSRYENAGRVILLAEHQLLANDDLNDFNGLAGEGYVIDLEDVKLRYLKGRLTVHNENIQANDEDQRIDEYLSEVGFQLALERKHGMFKGVTG